MKFLQKIKRKYALTGAMDFKSELIAMLEDEDLIEEAVEEEGIEADFLEHRKSET